MARWEALTPEHRRGFPPLCPDLVVELASPSDGGPRGIHTLRRKMAAYIANGAELGWLLIPDQQAVEIWRASGDPTIPFERLDQVSTLRGDPLLPGLSVDFAEIWAA
jgi:Uma2 family endonuclease